MANRIEIGFREGIRDALGEKIKRRIVEHLRIHVDSVKTIEVYTIDAPLSQEELEKAARGPLSDPVIQVYRYRPGTGARFRLADRGGVPPRRYRQRGENRRERRSPS